MLADISHGHADFADVLLLIAVVLFVVAAIVAWMVVPAKSLWAVIIAAGLACTSLALLVL